MRRLPLVVIALLAATLAHAQAPAPAKRGPVEVNASGTPGKATARRTIHGTGTVKAIDVAAHTVTLQNKAGDTRTFKVKADVRLDDIAVGDVIVIDYEQGLALEFQPEGSEAVPPTATASSTRAEKDQAPEATAAAGVKSTVTVTAIDLEKRLVSFQGPGGHVHQVKAGPKIQLEKLKVGDRLLATYVEAVAIQVRKPR